ncbi:putative SP-containing membrane protein [Vairimorpha necatrix]|uniref:SP-containing membrane protein n=1 Tax=Vairimorpha necatrix TaxID=6039 RepID=A0AAX4J919_9MICR
MSLKLYWYFLFNHCELILFVSYNGDYQCDLYIGKTNKADELNEFKIFISRDKNLFYKEIKDQLKLKYEINHLFETGLFLHQIDEREYASIRNLAENIENENAKLSFLIAYNIINTVSIF